MDQIVPMEDDGGQLAHRDSLVLEQYRLELERKTMSLLVAAKQGGVEYDPAPAGAHVARCFRIVDLGSQKKTWQGETKMSHQIMFSWELPTARMNDGRPFTINQRFTASLSEKAQLRGVLESWRGRKFSPQELEGFDLYNVLGKTCFINVVHNEKGDKTYANVASVMPVPTGMEVPKAENAQVFFSLSAFDESVFSSLPEGIQKTIKESPEFAEAAQAAPKTSAKFDNAGIHDDIPF